MRAVLMAGGSGTRLRPLTCDLPKPMVPILNRPIAEHIINLLRKHDITEIITTLHYLPDVMRLLSRRKRLWGKNHLRCRGGSTPRHRRMCEKYCRMVR
jgi:NDP-sugar pyrophosphorylase family protein